MKITFRDDTLPHQIRLWIVGYEIAVGCSCDRYPLELRSCWEPGEAIAVWQQHQTLKETA